MAISNLDEKKIFNVARKIDSANARQAYLRHVCGEDLGLLDRLTALLNSHEEQSQFLEVPAAELGRTFITPQPLEAAGTEIGPYKIHEQLGEGGMGVVYVAEQTEPVRRKVALKIIKPGMDSKEVIARFEAERQALAMMSHPNIAKVLDGGTTDEGRPYFVMELVKGIPMTKFCESRKSPCGGGWNCSSPCQARLGVVNSDQSSREVITDAAVVQNARDLFEHREERFRIEHLGASVR